MVKIEKIYNIYKCNCGFKTNDFIQFFEHFLNHKEIETRYDQLKKELEKIKEEGRLAQ
ncbi:hypothetical protein C57 [Sulfolobus turreted icosahedral virus 1]|uniref:Uncharacterized protein n=1 Tax=Sulfolobus turreted icosahedral virus 1 TaxID=269145 RepID=Q6Q0K5_9VIRU|nr:hypothetical protein C57 [Sulfolobus turreted icosahedral virus 1]AAS89086.1 hypothetical protein C57 [Sulfolobus turreted icosahedral virus 1]